MGSEGEAWPLVILAPDDPGNRREEGRRVEDAPRVVVQRRQEVLVGTLEVPSVTLIRSFVELRT